MITEIADIVLHGLVTDLYKAERAIFIHKEIGKHAQVINDSKSSIRQVFLLMQQLTFNEAVLSLARIYDTPDKKYPNRCVLRLIQILNDAGDDAPILSERYQTLEQLKALRIAPRLEEHLLANDNIQFTKDLFLYFETEYIQQDFQFHLNELKRIRDKILAHNEIGTFVQEIKWTTYDELILFVKKVIGIVGWAYLSTAYMYEGIHRLSESAEREKHVITDILIELKILNEA
ncbi:MAG: hypothetical protein M0Q38_14315 [Bacteroidales bacterium]|jgi:hypothetical protein|nr:hypothetical protein [Bacteroidales bacterium]